MKTLISIAQLTVALGGCMTVGCLPTELQETCERANAAPHRSPELTPSRSRRLPPPCAPLPG